MKRQIDTVDGEKITYWRSMENRHRTAEYLQSIENEFAADMTEITSMDRRSMLKVMGATIALSGLGISCRRPEEKILPYVDQPESITPGIANFFATAQPSPFGATGILAESHEGRPTKIEGNPLHPSSLGKASIFNQASVLELYDPDRSKYCVSKKSGMHLPVEWIEWDTFIGEKLIELQKISGTGLAFLMDFDLCPTHLRLKGLIKKRFPSAKFFVHDPLRQKNSEDADLLAFGKYSRSRFHFDKAKVICSIFADPFAYGNEHLRHMGGFAKNRKIYESSDAHQMNRLYAVEADYSLAGVNADHRMRLPISLCKEFLLHLAYELHVNYGIDISKNYKKSLSLTNLLQKPPPATKELDTKFVAALAKDLAENKGKALLIGGDHLSPTILAMIHVLNLSLLGIGEVFEVLKINDDATREHLDAFGIESLAKDIDDKKIDTLVMINVNPAYDAPRKLKFADFLKDVPVSIHMGLYKDETANVSTWHLPRTHFLENFSDTRAYDGTVSIIQPLIMPLYNARSSLELLAQFAGEDKKALSLIKQTHLMSSKDFDRAVHDGVIKNSHFSKAENEDIVVDCRQIYDDLRISNMPVPNKENLELIIRFDRKILDGRFANHSWLQELPDQITKMNWDNALLISPSLAKALSIKSGIKKNAYISDVVSVKTDLAEIELPTFVLPGLSEFSIIAILGYGRKFAGAVGNDVGVDVYDFLPDHSSKVIQGVKISKAEKTVRLSTTQEQFAMNADVVTETEVLSLMNRDPARISDLKDFKNNPDLMKKYDLPEELTVKVPGKDERVPIQLTKPWSYESGNQWGMVIDLASCTGCNACVIACQSENNIPVVGKEQVMRGRMMQWIRVDRYFEGDVHAPRSISQPVPCQHCENAPCEPVCPVVATAHDKEGLNVMAYNRCIGTRYCGNNCPFKVRRFNYFDFSKSGNLYVDKVDRERQKTLKLQRNPDVTVRYRGVMEKCTYCTQRIQEAKMAARRMGHDPNNLPDGAVTPACAQTCPSSAISFGNILDENSAVHKLKKTARNYTMLNELNVRPRTSYLSKLRNRNPELIS